MLVTNGDTINIAHHVNTNGIHFVTGQLDIMSGFNSTSNSSGGKNIVSSASNLTHNSFTNNIPTTNIASNGFTTTNTSKTTTNNIATNGLIWTSNGIGHHKSATNISGTNNINTENSFSDSGHSNESTYTDIRLTDVSNSTTNISNTSTTSEDINFITTYTIGSKFVKDINITGQFLYANNFVSSEKTCKDTSSVCPYAIGNNIFSSEPISSTSLNTTDRSNMTRSPPRDESVLVNSVKRGRARNVELLLTSGVDPNQRDEQGTPVLSTAVYLRDPPTRERIVGALLRGGADPNLRDSDRAGGATPLMHACCAAGNDHTTCEVVKMLLRHSGTAAGACDVRGNTALMLAAERGLTEPLLLLLASYRSLQHHSLIDAENRCGQSARELAEQQGHTQVAQLLRLEHSLVPRPSGFIHTPPTPAQLDRSPTPPQTLRRSSSTDCCWSASLSSSFHPPLSPTNTRSRTPPGPSRGGAASRHKRGRPTAYSPGSGNEADTESLMDADHKGSDKEDSMDTKIVEKPSRKIGEFHLLESSKEEGKLRKYGAVPSLSTGNLNFESNPVMPKISHSMRSMNRSIQHLAQEDLEFRPSHRPPTPARPSLPNLLPKNARFQDIHKGEVWRSSNNVEIHRITVGGVPRSASPSLNKHNRGLITDIDLNASTRSEGWDCGRGGASGSGVVHLPPIGKGRTDKIQDSRLTVAKKTLEQLDTVLPSEESRVHLHTHPRPPVHTH